MKLPRELEQGILPTFRLFTGIQFAITALAVLTQELPYFQSRPRTITLEPLHLLEPVLLFLYLSVPALRRRLDSAFLPLGILMAAVGLLLEPYIIGIHASQPFVTWLWRQTLFLCIPLYVVSWKYSMKEVLSFSLLVSAANAVLLSHALGFQLLAASSLMLILTVQLGLFLLIGVIVVRMMKLQRAQWQQLAEANARLAQYASMVEQLTISRERNRLARELHDVLAHTLSGVAVELEGLRATLRHDPEQASALLDHSLRAIREGLTETRRALQELRAQPLENLGLALAVQGLAESAAGRSGFELSLEIQRDLGDLPVELQQSIYRIAQEALANVADHAGAEHVSISLKDHSGLLELIVRDDGCGFDPAGSEQGNHYGLLGMRERAEMIGGEFAVESQVGAGTQVTFRTKGGT